MLFQRLVTHSYGVAINRNPILFRKATTNYHTLKNVFLLINSFFYLTLQQFCSAQEPRRGLRIKRESGESPVQSRCCEPKTKYSG